MYIILPSFNPRQSQDKKSWLHVKGWEELEGMAGIGEGEHAKGRIGDLRLSVSAWLKRGQKASVEGPSQTWVLVGDVNFVLGRSGLSQERRWPVWIQERGGSHLRTEQAGSNAMKCLLWIWITIAAMLFIASLETNPNINNKFFFQTS